MSSNAVTPLPAWRALAWRALACRRATCAGFVGLGCVFGALAPRSAHADTCALHVMTTDAVQRQFPALGPRVREALARTPQLEPCAQIGLAQNAGAFEIQVQLQDGRVASRRVDTERDVVPTLQALLSLPEAQPAANDAAPNEVNASEMSTSGTTLTAAPVHDAVPAVPASRPAAVQRLSKAKPAHAVGAPRGIESDNLTGALATGELSERSAFGAELSLLVAARVGDGQASLGFGVEPVFEVYGWLLGGMIGQHDYYSFEVSPSGNAASRPMLHAAALLGRRMTQRDVTWDVLLGPYVAREAFDSVNTQPAGAPPVTEDHGPGLMLQSRVNLFADSFWRSFAGVDFTLGSGAAFSPTPLERVSPPPEWMLGLAFGATLGTR